MIIRGIRCDQRKLEPVIDVDNDDNEDNNDKKYRNNGNNNNVNSNDIRQESQKKMETLRKRGKNCRVPEGGGTLEEEVPSGERERVCLSDDQALKLARLAVFLERAFGSPRDVEFAVAKVCVPGACGGVGGLFPFAFRNPFLFV